MELEKQFCIYCKRLLPKNKRRKNQWHVKCYKSIYGTSSSLFFQGEIVYKKDYSILIELEKEVNSYPLSYKFVKLQNLIRMFEDVGYVISNKAIIGLDLKFQIHTFIYDLIHLQSLYLSQFRSINTEISRLKNLHELVIRHSNIKELPDSIGKLTQLKYLEISGITGLQELPFSIGKLKNLNMLKIAPINERVKIQELPESINNLKQLEYFYLSGTNIKRLPRSFEKLENIRELYILSRSIIEIPDFTNFKKLRIFECQAKLTEVPESFSELEELEEVKIINNTITVVPNITKLQQLKKFEITNTQLITLPDGITKLQQLKNVIVAHNPIKILPDDFSEIITLESFDASQTNITKLPSKFVFPELNSLNLERTFITKLPEDAFLPKLESFRVSCFMQGIYKLPSLKQLYIMNTLPGKELKEFPEEIFDLSNLQTLDIGKASFTSLPNTFEKLPKLRILYLHKTGIRSIDGFPILLQEKIISRSIIIYVHPDFDFTNFQNTVALRIKY